LISPLYGLKISKPITCAGIHTQLAFSTFSLVNNGKVEMLFIASILRVLEILHTALGVSFPGIEVGRGIVPSGTLELVSPDPAGECIVASTTQ
jgi:hypothetical protein